MDKDELVRETAKIPWQELQRFFANGSTVYVAPELDLIEVALCVCDDNKSRIEQWMETGQVGNVTDKQAIKWLEDDLLVWSVVVKPLVLVQPVVK